MINLHEVIIPKVGMGITEVEISKWEVKIGDEINEGDPVSGDKYRKSKHCS